METGKCLFVSDFHLNTNDTERYHRVLNFLKNTIGKYKHLFLLGDTFEFWYNDRKAFLDEYRDIIDIFHKIKNSGCELWVFEGNHDIFFGKYFQKTLKARTFRKCTELHLNNLKIFLGHGDELIRGDIRYRILRGLLRTKLIKFIISHAPSKLVLKFALSISNFSRKTGKIRKGKTRDQFLELAKSHINKGYDVVIFGHTHFPEYIELGKAKYINCGDWVKSFSYVTMENQSFFLHKETLTKHS